MLYVIDWNPGEIKKMNVTSQTELEIFRMVDCATAIALDREEDRLYWSNSCGGGGQIEYANMTTIDFPEILTDNIGQATGITVFEDYVYWTHLMDPLVHKTHKSGGPNVQIHVGDMSTVLGGVVAVHPSVQTLPGK